MNTSGNKTASRAGQAFGGTGDRIMSRVVFCVAVTGIVVLIFILGFLIANGLPVLESTSLGEMFFSKDWYPTEEPPALGMVALIAGTLAATLLSSVMAIPVSIALAIFSAEIAPRKVRQCFKVLFEMLGFLPSIVLGFIGMMIIAPWMQVGLGIPSGLNLLNSSILLGFLIIPSVASLSDEALAAVPGELRDASYALGATRLETIFKVDVHRPDTPAHLDDCGGDGRDAGRKHALSRALLRRPDTSDYDFGNQLSFSLCGKKR